MRILLLSQWFDPEPGATKGLPFAKWLQQRGHDVSALTGFPNYPGGKVYGGYKIRFSQKEVMDGVDVLRVPLYPSHNQSSIKRFANFTSFALSAATIGAARVPKSDVGFVYHPPPTVGLAASVLKRMRKIPFVYHIADMWPDTVTESGMLRSKKAKRIAHYTISKWCNFVYREAHSITVLSPGFKELLIERGVPANKVHVIYNWTDEATFKPLPRDEELARTLGMSGKFNIVYAGNLGPMQGLDTVLEAAVQVQDRPEIQIVFAGTGHEERALKDQATALGLSNVLFLGRRQYWEMPKINTLADVLLVHLRDLPFFNATIPGKTQVSLASGKATLMAVAGDAAKLVEIANAGVSCPPENPAAMANAMRQLHDLPQEKLYQYGRNAHEFYNRELSLNAGATKTEALLVEAYEFRRKTR